jgi:hypothetical protein
MMRMFWLAGLGLICASGLAQAESASFKSPTGNINCIYSDYDNKPEVRCDILQFTPSFKTVPAGTSNEVITCTPAKLRGFTISPGDAEGKAFCPTDAAIDGDQIVLGYGQTFKRGGLLCTSETSGMTCMNAAGHGFSLSRATQKVF